jgi:hypothetical protein
MTLTTGATLIGLAAIAVVAWSLGGTSGTGVLAGGLLAASVTGFGLVWQRHMMRTAPKQALNATVVAFLLKVVVLASGALCLHFIEPLGARADLETFLLGFVGLAVVVLIPGTVDNVRGLGGSARDLPDPDMHTPDVSGGRAL